SRPTGQSDRASDRAIGLRLLKKKLFASWDRYMIPYPFSRGLFLYGDPLWVSREADEASLEAARLEVETTLNRLTAESEAAVNSTRDGRD
ncbi:MAG: lysophospholipid acyltransferase family protein, partial [Nitrospiraceae bacterium]